MTINKYQIRYKEGFFRALLFVLFVYAMYHKHNNSFFLNWGEMAEWTKAADC